MYRRTACIALLVLCGLMSSCVRTSTVVKMNMDGSGEIISRYYFSPQVLALIEQYEGAGAAAADGPLGNLGVMRGLVMPDMETLEKDSSKYGEGVSYLRHEVGKDDGGWRGYTVLYHFDDIRQIRIDKHSLPGAAKEYVEASGQTLDEKEGGSLTFTLEEDVLTIHSTMASAGVSELVDQKQIDQAKQMGMKPSDTLPMAAGATQGMRIGIFVRVEGEVEETSAKHSTGNLIIISDTEVSKVMQDPDFARFIDQAAEDPESVTEESLKDLFQNIEAMTIELEDQVTIKFK